jgi:SAM-dependent methyltransferase
MFKLSHRAVRQPFAAAVFMETAVKSSALLVSLMLSALVAGPLAAQSPHTHQHSFGNAEKWAQVFDDPKRDAWQKPHEVIEALRLARDARIADIGAGTGYFAVRFARMVPQGKIYAVDTEPDMVKHLAERAKGEKLPNIAAIRGAPDDPRIPESVDLIILVDVYHHIDSREAYFRRLRSALRPGGRLAIIDFKVDAPAGPPKASRIAAEQVRRELEQAGYRQKADHDFLPYQYFRVFEPAA